nr:hypothetical protein [Tanacetum cinerariifolium]
MIHRRVRVSKPKTMQDAIEITTKLRNKKISTLVECQTENKKRRDCPEQKNQNHESQIKSTKAHGVVHAFRGGEIEQDLNNIEDKIEA